MPVPFELRPDMPEEGLSAEANGLRHSEHVEQHLLADAREVGHPMVLPDHVPKTHLAMAMAELARDKGTDSYDAVHHAIFSAYYGEGRDIGSKAVLLEIAAAHGLDAREVSTAWDTGTYDERLHVFAQLALSLGVSTTPSALLCNKLVVGMRPYGVLREAMKDCVGGNTS
ncbi:MAG: hypothetical protein CVT59_06090 [Actinobacteria bacterium HGW-Actinobacteria-1]|jgi:predicted DsbA family dithiol-disulfide isomerase|nr:MAG: hypothetical protein CVT59_06090 [Actinobacteria bacterium HGW-Actinobacteria-1]